MTIASGGRGDTPLIAFGPMTVLFGIGMGFLALSSRQGQVAVDDTSYTVRGGLPTKTTTLVFSDAAMVRGGEHCNNGLIGRKRQCASEY